MASRRQGGQGRRSSHSEFIDRLVAEAGVPDAERAGYAGFCAQLYALTRRAGPVAAWRVRSDLEQSWLSRGLDLGKLRALAGLVLSAEFGLGMEV